MKLLIGIKQFREAFSIVGRFVAAKPQQPVYGSVKLDVSPFAVVLSGRDPTLGVGARCSIEGVKVERDGVALLPRSVVEAILKAADDETVSIRLDGLKLWIEGSGSKWSVTTLEPDTFGDWDGEFTTSFSLIGSDLEKLVSRTKHAIDPNSTRYALGGMNIEWADGRVRFEATDGRKAILGSCECRIDEVKPKGVQYVIPAPHAISLLAAFDPDSPIDVGFSQGSLVARQNGVSVFARLLEGRFPPLAGIIKEWSSASVGAIEDVHSGNFRKAVDRASAVLGSSSNAIRFGFTEGMLRLSGVDGETGTSDIEFPLDWTGPETATGFDPRFLVPVLKSLDDGAVKLSLFNKGHTLAVEIEGFACYIMAMIEGAT